jgi:branched-chain amino acid transport system ATP-binding protein
MLEVRDLGGGYGRVPVLHDISLDVADGAAVGLLGANGAGKSTLIRMIAGILRPARGAIHLDGRRIDGQRADRVARRGIATVPERRELFPGMSVRENLEMGAFVRHDRAEIRHDTERVCSYFPALRTRLGQVAGTLSGGEQQMVAIGRALMARPRLLLLDEPSIGLSPRLVEEIFRVLGEIHRAGTTLLLAEQNAWLTFGLAQHCYLLEVGRIVTGGPSAEVSRDARILRIYLGDDTAPGSTINETR